MGARLNIKNPHVVALARGLAKAEGRSITAVVRDALRDMAKREESQGTQERPKA